jgi:hypothetical protein
MAARGLCLAAKPSQNSVNPEFNFEGIEAFWKIVDILEADKEATEEQWNHFFEAPGYKALIEKEFKRAYFQNTLRAVFMPSQSGLKEQLLHEYKQRGGFLAWYTPLVLQGFQNARQDRKWLVSRVEELRTYSYLQKAAAFALPRCRPTCTPKWTSSSSTTPEAIPRSSLVLPGRTTFSLLSSNV